MTRLAKSIQLAALPGHPGPAAMPAAERPNTASWQYGSSCAMAAILGDFAGTRLDRGAPDS